MAVSAPQRCAGSREALSGNSRGRPERGLYFLPSGKDRGDQNRILRGFCGVIQGAQQWGVALFFLKLDGGGRLLQNLRLALSRIKTI